MAGRLQQALRQADNRRDDDGRLPPEAVVTALERALVDCAKMAGEPDAVAAISAERVELCCRDTFERVRRAYAGRVTFDLAPCDDGCATWIASSQQGAFAAARALQAQALLQFTSLAREEKAQIVPADLIKEYASMLQAGEAPYLVRYLLLRHAVRDPAVFAEVKPLLETEGIKLNPGHSQQHRQAAILPHFPGGATFVDIGCGPASYLRILAPSYRQAIGFEADPSVQATARHALHQLGIRNVRLRGAIEAGTLLPGGAHALMTEVLEHMPRENAIELLAWLARQPAEFFVLTVPNRRFNPHYGLQDGEFRHNDHHWEPDEQEFEAMVREAFHDDWALTFAPVGDRVAGVASGLLCRAQSLKVPPAARTQIIRSEGFD